MKKIKICLSVLVVFTLLSIGCSKKDSTTPTNNNNNNNNNTNTSPYYFRFTLNGVTDTFNSCTQQSWSSNTDAVLGSVFVGTVNLEPGITLEFQRGYWYDTIKEADVMGLAGKTVHFNDTILTPTIEYQPANTTDTWSTSPGQDTSNYVYVASVSFLDSTTYNGSIPVRRYVLTGNCRAQVSMTGTLETLTGSFKLIMARVVYK